MLDALFHKSFVVHIAYKLNFEISNPCKLLAVSTAQTVMLKKLNYYLLHGNILIFLIKLPKESAIGDIDEGERDCDRCCCYIKNGFNQLALPPTQSDFPTLPIRVFPFLSPLQSIISFHSAKTPIEKIRRHKPYGSVIDFFFSAIIALQIDTNFCTQRRVKDSGFFFFIQFAIAS